MAATATIPETVTVPGQLVYDAIVGLTAAKIGMLALADADSPLGSEFGHARYRLFEAAFGEFHIDDDLTMAPLAQAADTEATRCYARVLASSRAAPKAPPSSGGPVRSPVWDPLERPPSSTPFHASV